MSDSSEEKFITSIGRLRIVTIRQKANWAAYLDGQPSGIIESARTEAQAIGQLVKRIGDRQGPMALVSMGPTEHKQ